MIAGSCATWKESHLMASYSHWSRQLIKHLFTGTAIVMEYLLFNRLYPITSSRKRSRTEGLYNPHTITPKLSNATRGFKHQD